MSIFAVCVCAARWIFVPVFPRAPCLGKIQREVSELFWPVQMVYELMRSMWRGRCSLDTPREYWVFSVFLSLSLASADRIQNQLRPSERSRMKGSSCGLKVTRVELDENIKITDFLCFFRERPRDVRKWNRPAADSQPVRHDEPRPQHQQQQQQQHEQEHHLSSRNHRDHEEHPGYNNTDTGGQFSCRARCSAASHRRTYSREHSWQRHEVVFS